MDHIQLEAHSTMSASLETPSTDWEVVLFQSAVTQRTSLKEDTSSWTLNRESSVSGQLNATIAGGWR